MAKRYYDESKLRTGQKLAGYLLASNEFLPKGERKSNAEIAEQVGVDPQTIWRWKHKDPNFIAYMNSLSSDIMDSYLPLVYSKLIGIINQGNAKGIEMFLKRAGDLDSKQEVIVRDGGNEDQSVEERKKALLDRIKQARELDGETEGE